MSYIPRYFAIVPAAGIGSRFQSSLPKQYTTLLNKSILEHSLDKLLQLPKIEKIIVAIHAEDQTWSTLNVSRHRKVESVFGGEERADSVLSGLNAIASFANENDWVLVHDAARPCVQVSELQALINNLSGNAVGGLLAHPINDTLKRSDPSNQVSETVDRSGIWAAQTPQMFRYSLLHKALQHCKEHSISITDESMAVETIGFSPVLVQASSDNIKITLPNDLQRAEFILQNQLSKNKESAK